MRALPKNCETVGGVTAVRRWIEETRTDRTEALLSRVRGATAQYMLLGASACFAVMTILVTLAWARQERGAFPWPSFGTFVAIATAVTGAIGGAIAWIRGRSRAALWEMERDAFETAFAADPLVARATLILEAAVEHRKHCARYRHWRSGADADATDAADRYWNFITASKATIAKAAEDFASATKRHQRALAFAQQHPLPEHADGRGLSGLLAELDTPVAPPELPGMSADPARILEEEDRGARVAEELRAISAHEKT